MAFWAKEFIIYSSYVVLLPLLVAVVRYRRLTPALKMIGAYVLLGTFVQGIAAIMSANRQNNLPVLHVYTILEFTCFIWFYRLLEENFIKNKVFLGLVIGFPVLAILNALFLQSIFEFNTYARSLEGILLITLALRWYYRALEELKIRRLQDDAVFWINTAILLYFSGSVILFGVSNYTLSFQKSLKVYIWSFHALFSTLLYLFITAGLWKQQTTT
jgi:hypothetical protein